MQVRCYDAPPDRHSFGGMTVDQMQTFASRKYAPNSGTHRHNRQTSRLLRRSATANFLRAVLLRA